MSASRKVENLTASAVEIADVGITIPAFGTYDIDPSNHELWTASDDAQTAFDAGDIKLINIGAEQVQQLFEANGQSVTRIYDNQDFTIKDERCMVCSGLDIDGDLTIEGDLVLV